MDVHPAEHVAVPNHLQIQEVELHLAYRWFCRLDLEDKVPHHSTFSENRLHRFREGDVFRHIFERVVIACMATGLVKGEGFAVDASVMEANASRYHGNSAAARPPHDGCGIFAEPTDFHEIRSISAPWKGWSSDPQFTAKLSNSVLQLIRDPTDGTPFQRRGVRPNASLSWSRGVGHPPERHDGSAWGRGMARNGVTKRKFWKRISLP
jgi:hypothetical protein